MIIQPYGGMEKTMARNKTDSEYLPDKEIVDLYWSRDEKAIDETDKKYGKYLYTIAYNIIHSRLDCEECLNDTYLGTWNSIPPQRPGSLQGFLSRITRNIAVDRYRERSASKRIPSELVSSLEELGDTLSYDGSIEEEAAVSAVAEELNKFLRELDERDQFIFVCRYYYCDTIDDLSKMLSVSERTVFRAISKMREELRERLKEGGIEV